MRRTIIAGNWKMNKNLGDARNYLKEFIPLVKDRTNVDIVVCAPFTLLHALSEDLKGSNVALGAQNLSYADEGAYTGETSPSMIREFCDYVIVGHSERRTLFSEDDAVINKKVKKAMDYGFKVIFCIGETLDEREADRVQEVVERQLRQGLADIEKGKIPNIVIAYEPVWAIGTGKTASPEQAEEVHLFIRGKLAEIFDDSTATDARIIYGGSVKPSNAKEILSKENIDGALPGGASLEPGSFAGIIEAAM